MVPSFMDLIEIKENLAMELTNMLNNMELSSYAGWVKLGVVFFSFSFEKHGVYVGMLRNVEMMVNEIQSLANDGMQALSVVGDVVSTMIDALCINMGVMGASCNPTCGLAIAASCVAGGKALSAAVDKAVDAAKGAFESINETAEAPKIEASATKTPESVETTTEKEGEFEEGESSVSGSTFDAGNTASANTEGDVAVGCAFLSLFLFPYASFHLSFFHLK